MNTTARVVVGSFTRVLSVVLLGTLATSPAFAAKPNSNGNGWGIIKGGLFSGKCSNTATAPTIDGWPSFSLMEGESYSFKPTASDINCDALTFTITGKPAWAGFNAADGSLSGKPPAGAAGDYPNVVNAVSDGTYTTTLPSFTITVLPNGDWPVISSVTFMSGRRLSDSHVEYELDTATWLGPWAGGSASFEQAQAVERLITASGLKAKAFPDLLPAQWSKLFFNAVVNTVAALSDLPHVSAFARRDLPTDLGFLVQAAMDEGKRVAAAGGVELFEDPWEMNVKATSHGQTGNEDYAHAPSMLEDVRARRTTEVDWITGAIVREANRLGVTAPINETLYRLVKARELSWGR